MFARLTTVDTPDVDALADALRSDVLPTFESVEGFLGITASADRSAGVVSVLDLWEHERDLDASEALAASTHEGAAITSGGGVRSVRVFEHAVRAIGEEPPRPGCFLFGLPFTIDPDAMDDDIAYFRTQVLPAIAALPGFRAARYMVNRTSGEGIAVSAWDAETSMGDTPTYLSQARPHGTVGRLVFGTPYCREVIFSDLR